MDLTKEILTMLWAILPITELRFSIPFAISSYGLSVPSAFFWSVIGNIVTTYFLLCYIGPVVDFFAKRDKLVARIIEWVLKRTRDRATKKIIKYGKWALILFVGIPLPGTGAWTGSLIAYLFDIPKWQAFIFITIGILLSGVLVTLATLGVINSLNLFNI